MYSNESIVSVVVMSVELSRKVQKHVDDKASRNECLVCTAAESCRGLCRYHENQWRNERNALPKSKRANFDAKLIERGELAENNQGRRRDIENRYRQIAESLS